MSAQQQQQPQPELRIRKLWSDPDPGFYEAEPQILLKLLSRVVIGSQPDPVKISWTENIFSSSISPVKIFQTEIG